MAGSWSSVQLLSTMLYYSHRFRKLAFQNLAGNLRRSKYLLNKLRRVVAWCPHTDIMVSTLFLDGMLSLVVSEARTRLPAADDLELFAAAYHPPTKCSSRRLQGSSHSRSSLPASPAPINRPFDVSRTTYHSSANHSSCFEH